MIPQKFSVSNFNSEWFTSDYHDTTILSGTNYNVSKSTVDDIEWAVSDVIVTPPSILALL